MSWNKNKGRHTHTHTHNGTFALRACVTPICIVFIVCECDLIVGANKTKYTASTFILWT